jgi:DNA polymerase-1
LNIKNLQNLPSGSTYGKIIKNCFKAPDGWLFAYADFSALEDKVGAILSGDKNKSAEFTEGIDGHSMRCAAFFKDELEDRGIFIDMNDPASINRIKDEAPDLRGLSKGPSFGMQYGCAAPKLQKMLKCSMEKAEYIFNAFHTLYSGLGEFAKQNEIFAKQNGYIELAFGLKLQTPKINSKDNGVQSGEVRSASNAATQSYGMLMNRAFIEFQERLEASVHKNDVKLINTIHDAVYLLIREDADVIKWVNDNLVECMEWQEDPKLKSDVKVGAELDIGKDWAHPITLPNRVDKDYIIKALEELNGNQSH